MDSDKLSKSRQVAAKVIFEAFKVLKESGGQLPGREVVDIIKKRLTFNDWENEIYEKTGYVRWESMLQFYSIDSIKAGFLIKEKGIWYLTVEGEQAMKLGAVKLLEMASVKYRQWKNGQLDKNPPKSFDETEIIEILDQKTKLSRLEDQALADIKDYINSKDAYEFQQIVAALLRAMGYHTPFISPRGKDGGMDIIAYTDPLGALYPRIKVQVKHKPSSPIPVVDIRSLQGILNPDKEIGLFVTSGSYTSDSERAARESNKHVKLIGISTFITLWREYYNKLSDEDKNLLPLKSISFLGSND